MRTPLSRRDLLAAGVGVAAGLGGCLGARSPEETPASVRTTAEPSPSTAGRRDCSGTDAEALAPDPSSLVPPSAVEAAPGDCPSTEFPVIRHLCSDGWSGREVCENVAETTYRVVCSNAVDEDAPMAMVPGAEEVELPGSVSFSLVNGTDAKFATNYYSWRLWKRERGLWYHVAPTGWPSPLMYLHPGDVYQFCLTMDDSSMAGESLDGYYGSDVVEEESVRFLRVPALGGGEYAFGIFGWFEGEESSGVDHQTGCVARVSLDGDEIELTRSGQVEELAVEGDRATGHWIRPDGSDGDDGRGTYRLRRRDDAPGPRPLITEQLVRRSRRTPLRDAVAIAREHDVDEVHLEGPGDGSLSFGVPRYPFGYDGQVYATDSEVLETPTPEPTVISQP